MEVVFDPAKDAANVLKHGISLRRAEDFDVDTALYAVDDSQDYGEVRWIAIGWVGANLHSFTFTQDGERIRAISLRKATREEHRQYAEEC